MSVTGNEAHAFALSDNAKAVLDFVNPARSGRRLLGQTRQAGLKSGLGWIGADRPRSSRVTDTQAKIGAVGKESNPGHCAKVGKLKRQRPCAGEQK